jgi:RND family efflux transporter MFP subunit
MRFRVACALFLLGTSLAHGASALKGRLEWLHKVEMRVVESGVVEEVGVTAGQHVKRGDLLLRMDQREAHAHLLGTKARVARALVGSEKAERELSRTQELFDRGLIAEEELREAELERAAAVAEAESAKAAEAAAQVSLERTELRAPFDGIVVARNVWNGEVVYKTLQQKPLIVVAPVDRMLARILVTADALRRYPPGGPARVNLFGEMREAKVYSRGVEAARVEVQGAVYELDVIFDRRPDELLRPSEVVQVVLP